MFKSLLTLSFVLAFITQCLAAYQPVQGTQAMTMVGTGTTASWIAELDMSAAYADDITFSQLIQVANMGWNWLRTQPNAWTQNNRNCLVSALWVPGGRVYIGSIARGTAAQPNARWTQMKTNGPTLAPIWWKTKTGTGNHAEDSVLYQFESEQTRTNGQDGNGLKMATYGSFSGMADTVGAPVNPCSNCKTTAKGLEVNYFDKDIAGLLDEPDNAAKRFLIEGRAAAKKVTTSVKATTTSAKATTSTKATTSVKTTTSAQATSSAKATSTSAVLPTSSASSKASSSQISSASQASSSTGSLLSSSASQASSGSLTSSTGPTTLSTITTFAQSGSTIAEPTIKAVPFTYSLSDQTAYDKRLAAATVAAY